MAYAAVIFLKHNIQRLIDCTYNFSNFEITEECERSKINILDAQIIEAIWDVAMTPQLEWDLQSLFFIVFVLDVIVLDDTINSKEKEVEFLVKIMRRLNGSDGFMVSNITEEVDCLKSIIRRWYGTINSKIAEEELGNIIRRYGGRIMRIRRYGGRIIRRLNDTNKLPESLELEYGRRLYGTNNSNITKRLEYLDGILGDIIRKSKSYSTNNSTITKELESMEKILRKILRLDGTIDSKIIEELGNIIRRSYGNILKRSYDTINSKITKELESLEKILRLDGTRNRSNKSNRSVIKALDAKIREAIWKLEDVLESYVLYHFHTAPHGLCYNSYLPQPQGLCDNGYPQILTVDKNVVKNEICSFLVTVTMLKEEYNKELYRRLPREEDDDVLPTDYYGGKKSMTVGLSEQLEKIMNELLDPHPGLKTVALVGMAGIGKTHLAREIYQHPLTLQHFDLLVWVSIGLQQQQLENVWADIVAEVEHKPKNLYLETSIITLVHLLQKGLCGRRYLIVLDDVWTARLCYSLIWLLQAGGNGSSLLLTTRLEEVAKDLETSIHQMRFLNNEESWDLLRENVFADKYFPPQLEKAGRKIAEKCEGLPLLILAVGDILNGADKTEEYWNKVADMKTTTFPDAYDKIYKVLVSSYEYLPQYLKPCFLYMGVFPQSYEIPLSKMINLLIVEDFMEPERSLNRVMKTRKKACIESEQQSLTMVLRTPEKAHVTPKQQALTGVMRTATKFDKSNLFSTCRVMKSFETLYLLEPGPSLPRFITPFEKIDSLEQKPSLTRVASPARKFYSYEPEPEPEPSLDSETLDFMATLENFAMECVEKLVSNSLAIVCKHSSKDRIKSCKLHSAYWHLCVKEARKNKFFHVLKTLSDGSEDHMESQRRLVVQNNILFGIKEVYDSMAAVLTARSLLCTGEAHEYPVPVCMNLMLLRVLDALAIRFYEFPTEILKLLQLRYLALTHNGKVPSSISELQMLQFMIVRQHHYIKLLRNPTSLPKEIWDMQELRHLQIMGSNLPDPSLGARLPNLFTLHMNAHSCTEAVFRSIPELRKLGIQIELQPDTAETISCFKHIRLLEELESLKFAVVNPRLRSQVVAPPDHLSNLPRGLKKLSLNGLGYSWEYMNVIGWLPNLQVLKLRYYAFQGPEWKTGVGEFQSLEFLLLEDIDVVQWTTDDDDDDCFPHLRHLIVRNCYKLKEIIPQILPTLEKLEVVDCSPTIVASAQQINEDTNSSVQVMIKSSWKL